MTSRRSVAVACWPVAVRPAPRCEFDCRRPDQGLDCGLEGADAVVPGIAVWALTTPTRVIEARSARYGSALCNTVGVGQNFASTPCEKGIRG